MTEAITRYMEQLGSGEDAPDISLKWTAPVDGIYEISTLGSEADTVLTVFPGDCDRERELGCHDDQPGVSSSAILLEITEGTSVTFVISAFNADDAGPIALHISPTQ